MTDFSAWNYKSSIIVAGSPDGALANYQVEITIPYQSFMQTDFGDIRFTLSDGATEIPYFLESYTASSTATFCLNIPSIPQGTSNSVTVVVYAGNNAVTTTSNGSNTYDFFDQLTSLSPWTVVSGNWGITNYDNPTNYIACGSTGGYSRIKRAFSDGRGHRYQIQIRSNGAGNYPWAGIEVLSSNTDYDPSTGNMDTGYLVLFYTGGGGTGANTVKLFTANGTNGLTQIGSANFNFNDLTWYNCELRIDENGVLSVYINGSKLFNVTDTTFSTGAVIRIWNDNNQIIHDFQNLYISNYTANPPTVTLGTWNAITTIIPITGAISNQSGFTSEIYRQSLIREALTENSSFAPEVTYSTHFTGSITNTSFMGWYQEYATILLAGAITNNSIIQGRIFRESALGFNIINLTAMYPILLGDMIYFCGSILNVSSFNLTLANTIFYLIENVAGSEIQGITIEPVYQGNNSGVQAVVLQNIEGNPELNIHINAYSSLVPAGLESASENSDGYFQFSLSNNGGWEDSLDVTLPAGGSFTFYVQANIPANAVAGGYMCGINTTTTLNGSTYTQNLMVTGTVLTGNPTLSSGASANPAIVCEMGNSLFDAITKFTIDDKINVAATTFEINYTTALTPDEFESGQPIILGQEETTMLNGTIQDAEEDANPGNHTFVLTGNSLAQCLVEQSFSAAINCPVAPTASGGGVLVGFYTYTQILNMILANTPIQIGSSVNIPSNWVADLQFCGTWSTKKIAIDYFFYLLNQNEGIDLCWFVDPDGFLQTFDAKNPGAVGLYIQVSDPNIRSLKFVDSSDNVVNRITAYGGVDNSISVTVNDTDSQATYGIIEGPDMQDASMTTEAEVQAAAESQLALNCNPVYTATLVLPQFPGAVSGQPIMFVGHPKYGNTVFIISEVLKTGSQANYTTTIIGTTDPNVIAPMESFDMVQVVAQNVVSQNLPILGVCTGVNGVEVTVNTVGGPTAATALNPSSTDTTDDTSGDSGDTGGSSLGDNFG